MLCRRALQRVGPLTLRAAHPSVRNVAPVRHMTYGIPGSNNMTYFALCGGGLTAAMVYAYKTVNGDSERYNDRVGDLGATKQETKQAPVAVEAVAVQAEPAAAAAVVEEAVPAVAEEVPAVAEEVPAVAEEVPAPVETPEAEAPAAEAVSETPAEAALEVIPQEAVAEVILEEVVPEESVVMAAEAVPEAMVEDAPAVTVAEEGESLAVESIAAEAPMAVEEVAALEVVPPAESEGTVVVVEEDIPSPAECAPEAEAPAAATAVAA